MVLKIIIQKGRTKFTLTIAINKPKLNAQVFHHKVSNKQAVGFKKISRRLQTKAREDFNKKGGRF